MVILSLQQDLNPCLINHSFYKSYRGLRGYQNHTFIFSQIYIGIEKKYFRRFNTFSLYGNIGRILGPYISPKICRQGIRGNQNYAINILQNVCEERRRFSRFDFVAMSQYIFDCMTILAPSLGHQPLFQGPWLLQFWQRGVWI